MSSLSRLIRNVVWSKTVFEFWQRLGINVTRKHFYSPIPDTRELAKKTEHWTNELPLRGIDMNEEEQLHLLEQVFPQYKSELNFAVDKTEQPFEYYLNNPAFGIIDASVLHIMIRNYKPGLIIEVGSGYSTYAAARASLMNRREGHAGRMVSIEPYPKKAIVAGFDGLDEQIPRKVEDVPWSVFEQLGPNDILFIDSSHVVKTAGDVNFLYLQILPRLRKGVIVHIHDIFFPYDYPRQWVVDKRTFWTEQYLLQAFLALNNSYKVLFGNFFMKSKYPEKMAGFFEHPQGYRPRHQNGSFWMQRIS
ncbi:MAG: class I SAM-dependent methyltransferase [Sedimentisphaerales bacterium]|nr:class I SAM-dependent methyltransferase [Sedimentisphaerales bacterium]